MLDALFKPRSVAVIGASNNPLSIGYRIVQNLLDHRYRGSIYPVNPKASAIKGMEAYPSILNIPDEVDLANISVKNILVPSLMEECGEKGVKFVIIHSAGFKEVGEEGERLERRVVEIAQKHKMRICGPNSQGIQNSDRSVSLYANFTFVPMIPGTISIVAQSGGVGETLKLHLFRMGTGIRMYSSFGNESDVCLNEIIDYYHRDAGTKVIAAHLETIKNPAGFLESARRIAAEKPVLVLKTGKTTEGRKAVASHTGSLIKQDTLPDIIFKKSGVLRFHSQEEMINAALAFSLQPVPRGNRVAIITNTGGPAIIAVDESIAAGLKIARLSSVTMETLRRVLYQEAIISNPVDILATAGPDQFGCAMEALLKDPEVDAILLVFVTAPFVDCTRIARKIGDVARNAEKPIVCQVITLNREAEVIRIIKESGIPVYDFAETAARALAALARQRSNWERKIGPVIYDGGQKTKATEIVSRYAGSGRFLPLADVFRVLECYDIPAIKTIKINDRGHLQRISRQIKYPLVLKVDISTIVHKTERGGVALNLRDSAELMAAHDKMFERFKGDGPAFLVQEFQTGAKEVILGAKRNDRLPPTLLFGLGGVLVEIIKDVQFRLAPLSRDEIFEMIRSIKGYSVLEGNRGGKPADIEWLAHVLARLSMMAMDLPDVDEIDLNPVLVFEEGRHGAVVDARIKMK